MNKLRIIIFAKAPRPGFAKTRLIGVLGKVGAAKLAERLLQITVQEALAAEIGTVELCVTPSSCDASWRSIELPSLVQWSDQSDGDLGRRMGEKASQAIGDGEIPVIIGTDCPALDRHVLRSVSETLQNADACMLPVQDGGYALLALKRYDHSVFSDMPWSTNRIAALTRERIAALGWQLQEMAPSRDIDVAEDLAYLPEGWLNIIER